MDNLSAKKVKLYIRIRNGGHGLPEQVLQTGNSFTRENDWFVAKKAVPGNILPEPHAAIDLNSYHHVRADKIFSGDVTAQPAIVEQIASDLISGLISHNSACLIGYGGTATGKSFTILGNQSGGGVLQAAGNQILQKIKSQEQGFSGYGMALSAFLLRKDAIINLLENEATATSKQFKVEDPESASIPIQDENELLETVKKAYQVAKGNASVHMNALPRGHVIFNVILSHPTVFEQQHPTKLLQFVDLNGPERLVMGGPKTESMLETIAINEQLSSFRLLIENLSKQSKPSAKSGDCSHLFTGSKLCRLISRSLQPTASTSVILLLTAATDDRYHSDAKETAVFGMTAEKWRGAVGN